MTVKVAEAQYYHPQVEDIIECIGSSYFWKK
jgi:hypothetical protein